MKLVKSHKSFEGATQFWQHDSSSTGTPMELSTFVPPGAVKGCVIFLAGLTCTPESARPFSPEIPMDIIYRIDPARSRAFSK